MAVEKITAVLLTQPAQRRLGTDATLPERGATIRLILDGVDGDDLLVTTPEGLRLRLIGLAHLAGKLTLGELLLARVLANGPRLALSLIERPTPVPASVPAPADSLEFSAMRPDQLALRQIVWPAPNAAALAAAWRAQVLGGMEQKPVSRAEYVAAGLPLNLLVNENVRPVREPMPLMPPLNTDRWMFPAYGWGGLPVLLRLTDDDTDDTPPQRHRHQEGPALRLELELPGFGRIVVQVQLAGGWIFLTLAVEEDSTMPLVRSALPAIAAALVRADLRLRRCRLRLGLPSPDSLSGWTARNQLPLSAVLSPALFRAGAEVMLALSAAASAKQPNPGFQ